jgi:hypothetical protein
MSINVIRGDRIELLSMSNDPHPIETGARGTVLFVEPIDVGIQIVVDWDNGRKLNLIVPPDRYRKI